VVVVVVVEGGGCLFPVNPDMQRLKIKPIYQ
jgi:hypothetical protein